MRIKAKLKGDVVEVKVQAEHDMLTYDAAKAKGLQANFITYMTAKVKDKIVFEMSSSQFLSKNPIIKFSFKGAAKGDKIEMTWIDLLGNTVTSDADIR
jgi:sulfur-oxidizing protein SoxZ